MCRPSRGGERRYILADFGCCRSFRKDPDRPVTGIGSDYEVPEFVNGTARPKEYTPDVYLLGRMLYYLITEKGEGAVDSRNEKFMQMKPAFRNFIIKAAERNPAQRWKNGTEMVEALRNADSKSGTVISVNRNYRAAMQALRSGRYDDVRKIAAAGVRAGEEGCTLLDLYCRVREYLLAPDAVDLERLRGELDDMFQKKDSGGALCLLGILEEQEGNREEARGNMRDAADYGFVPAGYLYGRMLYDNPSNAEERQEGIRYILQSAEAGYWDALQFARAYLSGEQTDSLRRRIAEAELAELDARDGKILHRRRMHRDSVADYL